MSFTTRSAFSLLEMIVVVACTAIVLTLFISGISAVRDAGQKANCVSNLRQIGGAIAVYAADHEGKIPYGPKAGATNSAGNFYPSTGAPTSLISQQNGKPVGLGLLLESYLARTPQVLFCPGSDDSRNAAAELAKVGKGQAQGGYYYRHGGNTLLYDDPIASVPEPPLSLANLGLNRRGKPIRALVIDTVFLCPKELKSFGIAPVSNHRGLIANVLYTDGHVVSHENDDHRYTVDISDFSQVRAAFSKILDTLEVADQEP